LLPAGDVGQPAAGEGADLDHDRRDVVGGARAALAITWHVT
jgi:hypothetical protein